MWHAWRYDRWGGDRASEGQAAEVYEAGFTAGSLAIVIYLDSAAIGISLY